MKPSELNEGERQSKWKFVHCSKYNGYCTQCLKFYLTNGAHSDDKDLSSSNIERQIEWTRLHKHTQTHKKEREQSRETN